MSPLAAAALFLAAAAHDVPRTTVEKGLFRGWTVRMVVVAGEGPDGILEEPLSVEG